MAFIERMIDNMMLRLCKVPAIYGSWELRADPPKSNKEIKAAVLAEAEKCKGRNCPICGHCQHHCLQHFIRESEIAREE